jgi:hypothetical protein
MPGPLSIAAGARKIPWKTILVVARMAYQRGSVAWRALPPHEREHLRDLVAKSKGRPSNLTVHERRRLRELAAKALRAAREG